MIYKLVAKFRATGSALDKKENKKRHILTEEKLDEIGARLEASPKKSLR
jgi:transposase